MLIIQFNYYKIKKCNIIVRATQKILLGGNFKMKKRMFSLILAIAIVCQLATVIPVSAVTIIGANSDWTFDILGGGGSYAPYAVNVNPDGEYCVGDNSATLRLIPGSSNLGIQNVYFTVKGSTYYGGGNPSDGPLVTVQGQAGQGNWSGVVSFNDTGDYNTYTVYAYGVDNSGNIYFWTNEIKHESVKPTVSDINIISDDLTITGSNGERIVNNNISVYASVQDSNAYLTSSIKQVTMKLYNVGESLPIQQVTLPQTGDAHYWGGYTANFNLLNYGNVEKKLCVKVTAVDYCGNSTTTSQNFTYDRLSALGTITYTNATSDSVDFYFSANSDAAGITYPMFYFWTDANGQDDLQAVYGQQVSPNVWKATLSKSAHGYQSGLYHAHVWTNDYISNNNWAASTTYYMN